MLNLEKIKLGPAGEHLPADATDYVAVLYPALDRIFTATVINMKEAPQPDLVEACKTITLLGRSDWRLPDIDELSVIVDRSRSKPAIDPIFRNIPIDWLWSATAVSGSPGLAWFVYAYHGNVYHSSRGYHGFALAVCSASAASAGQ